MKITFDRMGRNHAPPVLILPDDLSGNAIAEAVYKEARKNLASRDVEVAVDEPVVTIYAGFHVAGTGTIER
jgi:hypothetical protein